MDADVTLLQKEKARFLSQGVAALYLFGSRASGKVGRLSDYDFAALFDETLSAEERFEKRLAVLGFLNQFFKSDNVDLVSLNDAPPLVGHRILKEGQLVLSNDEKQRLDAEVRIILMYLDWQPHLRRFIQHALKK